MEKSEKQDHSKALGNIDYRTIFVGDDTGLLKKLKMSLRIEKDIISEPTKKRNRKKRTLDEMLAGENENNELV